MSNSSALIIYTLLKTMKQTFEFLTLRVLFCFILVSVKDKFKFNMSNLAS